MFLIEAFIDRDPIRSDGLVVPAVGHENNIVPAGMRNAGQKENHRDRETELQISRRKTHASPPPIEVMLGQK
jgi:hypothetical protein